MDNNNPLSFGLPSGFNRTIDYPTTERVDSRDYLISSIEKRNKKIKETQRKMKEFEDKMELRREEQAVKSIQIHNQAVKNLAKLNNRRGASTFNLYNTRGGVFSPSCTAVADATNITYDINKTEKIVEAPIDTIHVMDIVSQRINEGSLRVKERVSKVVKELKTKIIAFLKEWAAEDIQKIKNTFGDKDGQ